VLRIPQRAAQPGEPTAKRRIAAAFASESCASRPSSPPANRVRGAGPATSAPYRRLARRASSVSPEPRRTRAAAAHPAPGPRQELQETLAGGGVLPMSSSDVSSARIRPRARPPSLSDHGRECYGATAKYRGRSIVPPRLRGSAPSSPCLATRAERLFEIEFGATEAGKRATQHDRPTVANSLRHAKRRIISVPKNNPLAAPAPVAPESIPDRLLTLTP